MNIPLFFVICFLIACVIFVVELKFQQVNEIWEQVHKIKRDQDIILRKLDLIDNHEILRKLDRLDNHEV